MKKLAAHWQILASLVLATLTAIAFRGLFDGEAPEGSFVARAIEISEFIGDLFMRALKMIIVPLIVTSVISGIASLQGVEGVRPPRRENLRRSTRARAWWPC